VPNWVRKQRLADHAIEQSLVGKKSAGVAWCLRMRNQGNSQDWNAQDQGLNQLGWFVAKRGKRSFARLRNDQSSLILVLQLWNGRSWAIAALLMAIANVSLTPSVRSQTPSPTAPAPETQAVPGPNSAPNAAPITPAPTSPSQLDLDPKLIQDSPVLQRWLTNPPDLAEDIRNDPSFRTRLRLGYVQYPSTDQAAGWQIGIEDVMLARSRFTLSADYQAAFNGDRESWGADLRYYVLPLGSVINIAPQVGYRRLETPQYTTDGVNLGAKLLLVPSRTGAVDLALTQTWVNPGGDEEVGLTTLSVGYALTRNLRLSTDFQKQNSRFRKDSRVGISVEWMF